MGKKKKRRRRNRPAAAGRSPQQVAEPDGQAAPEPEEGAGRAADEPPERRGLFARGLGPPSPYPGLWVSLARGLRPVGASPAILAVAAGYLLAVWAFFVGAGAEPPAGLITIFAALPPVPTLFDALILLQEGEGAILSLGLVLGVTLIRTVALGLLVALVVRAVEGERPDLREALRGLRKTGPPLFAVLTAELGMVLAGFVLVQGFLGGQLAIFAVWLLGLQFLVMAPVVIARERVPAAEGLRRSFRAARLPGMRHFSLVIVYFFLVQVTTAAQAGIPFEATPSILTWVFALFITFIHAGVLGALGYRWAAVRDEVPAGPAKRERNRSRR